MWDFLDSIKCANVIQCVDAGGKTAVEAENLVIDESSEG